MQNVNEFQQSTSKNFFKEYLRITAVIFALSIVSFFGLKPSSVFAANTTCTWNGVGGNVNFSTPTNWSGCGGVPTNGDKLAFPVGDTDNTGITLNNDLKNLHVASISITYIGTNGGGVLNIGGNPFTLSGELTGNIGSWMDVKVPITLSGDIKVSQGYGFTDINLNGHNFNTTSSSSIIVYGLISGKGNLNIDEGAFLEGSGSWTGKLTIGTHGQVYVSNMGALGSQSNPITIASKGYIQFDQPNGATIPQNITAAGDGILTYDSGPGAIQAMGDSANGAAITLTGKLTLTADTDIEDFGGTMTITGSIGGKYTITHQDQTGTVFICSSNNQSKTPNSSNCSSQKAQQVISWALQDLSKVAYYDATQGIGLCLEFMRDAWLNGTKNVVNIGGDSNSTAYSYWQSNSKGYDKCLYPSNIDSNGNSCDAKNPPEGALVFWGPNNTAYMRKHPDQNVGHVALSLGSFQQKTVFVNGKNITETGNIISSEAYPYSDGLYKGTDHDAIFLFTNFKDRSADIYNYLGWMLPQ